MKRVLFLLLVLFLVAASAYARVGGGESYSGGGSSSSGGRGGGSDGGDAELLYYLFRFLLWLTMEYPAIGIPVDIVVVILLVRWWRRKNSGEILTISTVTNAGATPERLDALRKFDPNFSEITFSDFCYSLYAKAHYARGTGDLERYAPYLSENAREALRTRGSAEVTGVIIGSMTITSVRGLDTPTVTVTILFESNYTENGETAYVKEQWVLERKRDILSPPPEKAKADHCPLCGAALQTRTDGA